jgi:hypothetical protein
MACVAASQGRVIDVHHTITQADIASAICIRKNLWPGQLESVLKLTGMKTDLLINFNVPLHKDCLKCISF